MITINTNFLLPFETTLAISIHVNRNTCVFYALCVTVEKIYSLSKHLVVSLVFMFSYCRPRMNVAALNPQ
jgi:hypothetical protein